MIPITPSPVQVEPRSWGEEITFARTDQYMGRVLRMIAGGAGGLQFHHAKDETFYLLSGRALVTSDPGDGTLRAFVMEPGDAVHVPPGAPHKVKAITNCVFVEASTPHMDDRVRVEAEYGLPEGGGLPSTR